MTEDEAKTKWCPFSRQAAPCDSQAAGTNGNRWGADDPTSAAGYRCIGSACMAWRWSQAKDTEGFLALVRERVKTGENYQKALAAALIEHRNTFERTEGYCGLAGAPRP